MSDFHGIIPARFASTRFPGKPLADINGKSMVMRVFEQAQKSGVFKSLCIATDDERIFNHVRHHGGNARMTAAHHRSGTERCAEVAEHLLREGRAVEEDIIINIQGDEPYIATKQIKKVAGIFSSASAGIATLIKKIENPAELFDENTVKAVPGAGNRVLYFSRLPVPFLRSKPKDEWLQNGNWFKHIGMYAYRIGILKEISKLEAVNAEIAESLEQLRWLAQGYSIYYAETSRESISVDCPDDLLKLINKT